MGRYVCTKEEPHKAEVAITVLDSFQGLGLSSLLLWALSHVAHKNGVQVFVGLHHPNNLPVSRMVHKLRNEGLLLSYEEKADACAVELALPVPLPRVAGSATLLSELDLFALMQAVDGQAVVQER